MRSSFIYSCAGLAVALSAAAASAQFFGQFNLVVTQLGDGQAALSNAATPVLIREFTRDGVATGQELPIDQFTMDARLTMTGNATSEGFITGSYGTSRYLTIGGYNAGVGTINAPSTSVTRVVGRIDTWTGAVEYNNYGATFSGNNIRSTQFDENNNIFLMTGSNGGVRSGVVGGASSTTPLSGSLTNTRVVNIFNGQTFVSSASGANQGVSLVTGSAATILPGMPTTSGPQAYDFVFANDRTLYVADERAGTSGGLQKWVRTLGADGDVMTGNWALAMTFNLANTAGTGFVGLRGLTGETVGGITTLFATSADAISANAGNRLVTLTDTGPGSTFAVLATAPGNTAWRGVEIIPTPGAAALLGFGMLAAARRRR